LKEPEFGMRIAIGCNDGVDDDDDASSRTIDTASIEPVEFHVNAYKYSAPSKAVTTAPAGV
jgi:hypothetical protein